MANSKLEKTFTNILTGKNSNLSCTKGIHRDSKTNANSQIEKWALLRKKQFTELQITNKYMKFY